MMLDIIILILSLAVQNKYPATRLICANNFDKQRYINNQKVQVANEIKRDICKYLVSSDVADDV